MVGSSSGACPVSWSERETMLYALGVGAGLGDPARELHFTTENSGGIALQAVPSFLTILTVGQKKPAAMAGLDVGRFLHAEQRIELFRPLPPAGCGVVETVIDQVVDKGAGSGAIITNVATLRLEGDPEPIGRSRSSIFVRGAGGFGGQRGTAEPFAYPDRSPDIRIAYQTRAEQALLYRLSGDRHRLHSDPPFAQERGFSRPIMHGLCTYGIACRALVEGAAGGDPLRLKAMAGRFSRPAYPGDTLTTEIWIDGEVATFRTIDGAGETVFDRGTATIAG
ncbi:enoyl-CoA hydratase [Nostoc sp. 3335mG]|nr:enoyl-CoA hydratase [Nostoc sp. 3335mG]